MANQNLNKDEITIDILEQYKDALRLKNLNQELYNHLCASIFYLVKYSQKYNIPLPKREALLGMIEKADFIIDQFAIPQQPTGNTNKTTEDETEPFKVLPLYPTDEDKKLIRIDGLGRENLDTVIGGIVRIKKVKAVHCDNYVVAPLEDIPPIDKRYLSDALESLPVKTGHNVLIPYFGGRLKFVIKATTPEGAVIITQKSKCTILDKKPSEYDEVEQALIDQKSELVDKLKRAVKDKNAKDIIKLTNEIADLDLLNSTIKNVLSGRQLKVKPLYHGIIRDALEEALRNYADKRKEEKKEK